jgi:hypothetical protein
MGPEEVPLVYQPSLLSQPLDLVKSSIVSDFEAALDDVLSLTNEDASDREIEERIWDHILDTARSMMSTAMGLLCCRASEEDIRARGLTDEQVRLRNDHDYWITMMTTFGPVLFFSFAYRDSSSGLTTVTRTPARQEVIPLHASCHSSQLCLETETKLGQEMPFRKAQKSMVFFTHGAVSLEDTTIERHMVAVSRLVDRTWLYQPPEKIREVLRTRATRDLKTGKPLLYFSSDAHALRRFVDETWDARWKMANGLRLWCIDRFNGRIIHLGGEYTWGDSHVVAEIVDWLIESGHVPADGDYGEAVVAQIVLPTDGMPWIEDSVVKKFSDDAVALLDPHHVFEHLKDYAAARFGKGTPESRAFLRRTLRLLLGPRREKKRTPRKSRKRRGEVVGEASLGSPSILSRWEVCEWLPSSVEVLIGKLLFDKDVPADAMKAHVDLIDYFSKNAYRMNYLVYRSRGYQLGSGAMESLHRSGSQVRLKLPGLKALPETSQAIFNLRMLDLCGRWDEFWKQPGFYDQLVEVFTTKPKEPEWARQEAA